MMYIIFFLVVVLSTSARSERAEFTLGGVDGNAWQVPLAEDSETGGFYAIFDSDGQQVETVVIGCLPRRMPRTRRASGAARP